MAERVGWLRISEYCTHYNVHRKTVRKWIEGRYLRSYQQGRILRVEDATPRAQPLARKPTS